MYSMMLMAALTAGTDVPDCHWRRGCSGCHGGCYGCAGGCAGCSGCGGCAGYYGAYGANYGGYYAYTTATVPVTYVTASVQPAVVPQDTTASLIVELPADAKLYIDGQSTQATSARREFISPPLDAKQSYFYNLKAELVRDGKTYDETRRVTVKAGKQTRASFPDLAKPVVSAKTVAITK